MAYKKTYTAEERAAYNEKKQAEMEEMIKKIDEGVQAVFHSDKYKEYLKFVSKFTDYSARNTMLINVQKPDATLVAAYGKWKQLGRQVDKGQTGIAIFAPVPYKTNDVLEVDRPAVDEFGNQLYDSDGTEKIETVEKPITGMAFKKVYVFDVSQTSGKELPEPVIELTGNIDTARKEAVFAALKKVTGIDIEFRDIKGSSNGYYSPRTNQIVIKSGMSDVQTLKTAFHEAAHNLLHDPNKKIVTVKSPRNEKEVQAESVAFIVAEKFGMDTSEYSFPYIASWSDGKQLEQLKNALQEIQTAAKKISTEIESELLKMQKRQLSMDEKLDDDELNNIQKAEFLIEDCNDRGVRFSPEDTNKILDFAGSHEDIGETVQLVSDMEQIQRQRDSYGYDFTHMTPIDTKEAALEAFGRGEAVYLLYPDNTEGQALERSEIENFDGYFGIEKEPSRDAAPERDSDLIPVSKDAALEMWDKDLDVYIDGIRADSREQIEAAPDTAKLYLSEFQYSAELNFDQSDRGNAEKKTESVSKNPNVIGNTPYSELGGKSELKYYTNLKNRHAANVAKQLDEDGVKFNGLKKGTVTTITINKADIPKYEAAVEKVKASYVKNKEQSALKKKPELIAEAIDKAISENNYELYYYDLDKAADAVISKYGTEQVSRVLAEYIKRHDYDGRISRDNKEWARDFQIPENIYAPVFHTHPTVLDGFISQARLQIQEMELAQSEIENPQLSEIYSDKFLLPIERVELRDDYRGIPETKYYKSPVNEYFVEDIGWLDNAAYDREQRFSKLNAKDFYAKVTKVSASYVDSEGKTGQIDVTKQDYDLLTEKTNSPENAEAYETAKLKLAERKQKTGISVKPVEYYAVRKMNDRKFAVCSISADGLVTVVKPYIATVAEAKKVMLEIFDKKKDSVKCEFVHPQTLDEKSAEIYRTQPQELPDVTYRIKLNTDKTAAETHILQEYISNGDDTYKIGKVLQKGDYDKCNSALANILVNGISKEKAKELQKLDFEIYQLRGGEETRDYRFEPFQQIMKRSLKPEFENYIKVYEGGFSILPTDSNDVRTRLEAVFQKFNTDRPDDFKGHSLSVSDVVVMDDKAYYVDGFGFQPLEDFIPLEKKQDKFLAELPERLQSIAEGKREESTRSVFEDAMRLKVDPAVIREASFMVDDKQVDDMADTYEQAFRFGNVDRSKAKMPKKPKI